MKNIARQPLVCPQCDRPSDQDLGIPCSMCLDRRCTRCVQAEPTGSDGLCEDCASAEALAAA